MWNRAACEGVGLTEEGGGAETLTGAQARSADHCEQASLPAVRQDRAAVVEEQGVAGGVVRHGAPPPHSPAFAFFSLK